MPKGRRGVAVAEVDFNQPEHVSRAEKSWKIIANSLQLVLGCNVEIRINLVPCASVGKSSKMKKPSFSLLSCSRRVPLTAEDENQTDISDFTSGRAMIKDNSIEVYSSDSGTRSSPICDHHGEPGTAIRNREGNALGTSHRVVQDVPVNGSQIRVHSSNLDNVSRENHFLAIQEPESKPSCFPKNINFQRKLSSAVDSHTICLRIRQNKQLEISIPRKPSFEAFICTNDPYVLCSGSNTFTDSSKEDDKPRKEDTKTPTVRCWRAPKFPLKKAWQLSSGHRKCQVVGCLLPCSTVK